MNFRKNLQTYVRIWYNLKYDEGDDCMIKNLLIVRVDSNYCDYLRKFDTKVAYNMNEKELRPFVGILFRIEDCEYFAPLSSP